MMKTMLINQIMRAIKKDIRCPAKCMLVKKNK